MISTKDLRTIARSRLRDAEVLLKGKRFDAAYYLSGYAVELALKARICRTLKWAGFPESRSEFEGLLSLKTHDLEVLLKFSGIEDRVGAAHFNQWSIVTEWRPEKRYQAIGLSAREARIMIASVEELLKIL